MQKIVIDTNVLVSALISPLGPSARIICLVERGEAAPCYDSQILAEYSMVLTRAKFNFNKDEIKRLINLFMESGLPVIPKTSVIPMLDESDRVFYDVAQTSRACLITGNLKHYPQGPFIMSPAAFLEIADGRITGATP